MRYEGTVYRPPSEANSLIVQVTIGCSQNSCTFCSMYKDKKFRIRNLNYILSDLSEGRRMYDNIEKIFLADGDALFSDMDTLEEILDYISITFPECKQVSCYATAKSILFKTPRQLRRLRRNGLKLLYIGLESGCDEILKKVKKRSSSKEMIKAVKQAKDAGFKISVTAISGLGGEEFSKEHAIQTANALSQMDPEYIGLLTLIVEDSAPIKKEIEKGTFKIMDPISILNETRLLIENLDCTNAIFRSNHASNYLNLKGTLNQDKEKLLKEIDKALNGEINLKDEYLREL